jgi:phosphoribosylamine--glycine ligase
LKDYSLEISPDYATTVVMVSGGYPGSYQKGHPISLPDNAENAIIFHAGTGRKETGELTNQGGRVIAVTGRGKDLEESLQNTFQTVNKISWKDHYFRKDIGQDILKLIK